MHGTSNTTVSGRLCLYCINRFPWGKNVVAFQAIANLGEIAASLMSTFLS